MSQQHHRLREVRAADAASTESASVGSASTGSAPTDGDLLEGARRGDPDAVAELWRRHYAPVCRWAQSMTGRFEPDELVSEAFARLMQALRNGRGPTSAVRPYLKTVARNLSMEWARRSVPVAAIDDLEEFLVVDDPYEAVDAAVDASATVRAFRSLPASWQRVLWLGHVEGMPAREIASELGMNANAVAALRFRAAHGFRRAYASADGASGRVA